MDNLAEALKKWLNFRPTKRVHVPVEIEPLVLDDPFLDDDALYFVVGMGEHDGTP